MSQQADVERVALSMREVAQAISVSERTVWTAIKSGKLKASKVGRLVRIRPTDLEKFITFGESEVRRDA